MNKLDLILNLLQEGKITTEQAKVLMEKEKEFVCIPNYPVYDWQYRPYQVTYQTTPNYIPSQWSVGNDMTVFCSKSVAEN